MYDLLVIVGALTAAWLGSQMGVLAAGMLGAEVLAAVTAGVLLHESLAGLIIHGLKLAAEPFLPKDFPYQSFAVATAFILLTWGSFAAIRFALHGDGQAVGDDADQDGRSMIEKVAGGLVGGCAGVMLCGALLLTLSMLPLPRGLQPRPQNMFLDAGGMVLRMAAEFEPDRHEDASLVVHGEPASRASNPRARLAVEPSVQVAVQEEGRAAPEPLFSDVDGNSVFTKDLYFLDLDGDNMRRVGLRDKYVLNDWSGAFDQYARSTPNADKPAATSPASQAAAPAPPPVPIAPVRGLEPEQQKAEDGPKKPKAVEPAPEEPPPSDF